MPESRRCCNVNTRSENGRRKHNVVRTLVFDCSNDVGNATLSQYNQNLTLLQSRVPAGLYLPVDTGRK